MSSRPYQARPLALNSLHDLEQEFARLKVDKGGIPIMASKGILRLILVEQIPSPAANIIKQEILARGGDLATPWTASAFRAKRVDVIFIGTLSTLRSTISKLYRQPVYDLPLIADAVQKILVRTTPGYLPVSPRPSRQGQVVEETLDDLMGGRIPLDKGTHRASGRPTLTPVAGCAWRLGEMTYLVSGIPSQPSLPEMWQRVQQAAAAGAHMVAVDPEPESAWLAPLLAQVRHHLPDLRMAVHISTPHQGEAASAAGAHLLVSAPGTHQDLLSVAASTHLPLVLSFSGEGAPAAEPSRDLMDSMVAFFHEALDQAAAAGVDENQIILSPGKGERIDVLRRFRELTGFGRPLLYTVGDSPGVDPCAAAAKLTVAIAHGADLIYTQQVNQLAPAAKMADALIRANYR